MTAPRRRSRGWLAALVVLVLLAGAAIGVDRWVHAETQRRIAAELAAVATDGTPPDVTIGGFPFLTQYVAGELDEVTIRSAGITYDGLTFTDVAIDAGGVPTDLTAPISDVRLDAVVPGETLTTALRQAEGMPDGIMIDTVDGAVTASVDVLGLEIEALLVPRADGRAIAVDVAEVRLGGVAVAVDALPGFVAEALRDLRVPIDQLPDGLELTAVEVTDAGVHLVAEGRDVVLPTS